LKNLDSVKQSEDELHAILDEAESQLGHTTYLAGEEFTLADSMFIPLLVRVSLLDLEDEYINTQPNVLEYYNMVKKRSSYKIVIEKYFGGWKKYCTLYKTACFLLVRNTFRRY
jgi:ganglioside-induced differentiation-associated protein 1